LRRLPSPLGGRCRRRTVGEQSRSGVTGRVSVSGSGERGRGGGGVHDFGLRRAFSPPPPPVCQRASSTRSTREVRATPTARPAQSTGGTPVPLPRALRPAARPVGTRRQGRRGSVCAGGRATVCGAGLSP
jgi:hypothetical protein